MLLGRADSFRSPSCVCIFTILHNWLKRSQRQRKLFERTADSKLIGPFCYSSDRNSEEEMGKKRRRFWIYEWKIIISEIILSSFYGHSFGFGNGKNRERGGGKGFRSGTQKSRFQVFRNWKLRSRNKITQEN